MMSERVTLRFYKDERQQHPLTVVLPEVTGQIELRVSGVDTRSAVDLLQCMFNGDAVLRRLDVERLTAADRDTLLAALHRICWGDRIMSSLHCRECDALFDLSFQLSELQRHLWRDAELKPLVDNALLETGAKPLAVPTAGDEIALAGGNALSAAVRLAASMGVAPEETERAADQLESAAPIIDVELDATCPECSAQQQVGFDIQTFVMQRLLDEREHLLMEIHLIALNYGWSLNEIAGLPRSTRKSVAQLIDDMA